jgi:hypothetical protein
MDVIEATQDVGRGLLDGGGGLVVAGVPAVVAWTSTPRNPSRIVKALIEALVRSPAAPSHWSRPAPVPRPDPYHTPPHADGSNATVLSGSATRVSMTRPLQVGRLQTGTLTRARPAPRWPFCPP